MVELLKNRNYNTRKCWDDLGFTKWFQGNIETIIKNYITVSDFLLSKDV